MAAHPHPERLFTLTGDRLRLTGRQSLGSWVEQSLVARRQTESRYTAETVVEAAPMSWQQAAGLVTYYNRHKVHAALVTVEGGQRGVTILSCPGDWPGERLVTQGFVPVPEGPVTLGVTVDGPRQRFHVNGAAAGPELDASVISDEGGRGSTPASPAPSSASSPWTCRGAAGRPTSAASAMPTGFDHLLIAPPPLS